MPLNSASTSYQNSSNLQLLQIRNCSSSIFIDTIILVFERSPRSLRAPLSKWIAPRANHDPAAIGLGTIAYGIYSVAEQPITCADIELHSAWSSHIVSP